MTDDVRARVEQAVRELPLKPDADPLAIEGAINLLTIMVRPPSDPPGNPRNFRNVGKAEVRRELRVLLRIADQDALAKVAAGLSRTTNLLLANGDLATNCAWFTHDQSIEQAKHAAQYALRRIENGEWKAPKSDLGKPINGRIAGTAVVTASIYEELTCNEVARSWRFDTKTGCHIFDGPFIRFLNFIFEIAGIRASAEHYVRHAKSELRKRDFRKTEKQKRRSE